MPLDWIIGAPAERLIEVRVQGGLTLGPQLRRLSDQLMERIRQSRATALILDLGELTSLDSAGLGELVILHTQAAERGCRVVLAATPARFAHVLVTTKLDGLIESFESVGSARSAVNRR